MKTPANIIGIFDTDVGRLVGVAPQGVSDVSYFDTYDTPPVGAEVRAITNPVTWIVEIVDPVSGDAYPLTNLSTQSQSPFGGKENGPF